MKNYRNYDFGFGFKPISPWGYIGYLLLWCIPVIGWLVCLCTAIGGYNRNVRNFARSIFCAILLALILAVLLIVAVFLLDTLGIVSIAGLKSYVKAILDAVLNFSLVKV